jgi:hypothetical protein
LGKLLQLSERGMRQARRLLNLLLGLAFLFLAIAGAMVSYGEYRIYQQAPADGPLKFWVVAGFTAFLFLLGLYSFAKARSVR